jgi:hypothetical protein
MRQPTHRARGRYALDVAGPAHIFVLCCLRDCLGYGRRIAGPFGNEHAALAWIDANATVPFSFLGRVA